MRSVRTQTIYYKFIDFFQNENILSFLKLFSFWFKRRSQARCVSFIQCRRCVNWANIFECTPLFGRKHISPLISVKRIGKIALVCIGNVTLLSDTGCFYPLIYNVCETHIWIKHWFLSLVFRCDLLCSNNTPLYTHKPDRTDLGLWSWIWSKGSCVIPFVPRALLMVNPAILENEQFER